jgi:tetratricopeptide (TPR) repeat protein
MLSALTSSEEAQLTQTIEMFEVITQSQPQDYQSLEILKEAYFKLGREKEVIGTSKRIAQAYVAMGQLSSAILEYESILQRYPDDPDVLQALGEIESKANSISTQPALGEVEEAAPKAQPKETKPKRGARPIPTEVDDGRQAMQKIFVEGKIVSVSVFDQCWSLPDLSTPPTKVVEPFIQVLADKGATPLEKSLRVLSDKGRIGFLPLDKYDLDIELARTFPVDTCRRWCVLPFDRLSKSILVATANPYNRQASQELEEATKQRLLWYLAHPADIIATLRKVFR